MRMPKKRHKPACGTPPPRTVIGDPSRCRFAADAHHCIMVWVLAPTEYKDAARTFVRDTRALLERYPDHHHGAGVLGAVKVWPSDDGSAWQRWRDGQP
jgi:hypothetical protein